VLPAATDALTTPPPPTDTLVGSAGSSP
jgi:hypothetical protein